MFELIPFERNTRSFSAFDPFRGFDEIERTLFNDGSCRLFRTDVIDCGDAYSIEAELPGFSKEDIGIDIENDCLTINVERKYDEEEKKKNFIKRERFYGSFSRSFDVSGITVENIEAEYNDGILKLTLPKKPENIPVSRKLEIK